MKNGSKNNQDPAAEKRIACQWTITLPPKADDIVGVKCETLVKSIQNPDPRDFPEKLLSIIGKKHIFQFHYNTSSKQTQVDFILYKVLDLPDTSAHIENKASGSATIEEESENVETYIAEPQQPVSAIEYTSVTKSPLPSTELAQVSGSTTTEKALATIETSIPEPEQQIVAIEYTPLTTSPPALTEFAQVPESAHENPLQQQNESAYATPHQESPGLSKTSTKPTIEESSVPTKTKRQLFQDNTEDRKKKKKE